jgi:hypothetical protein
MKNKEDHSSIITMIRTMGFKEILKSELHKLHKQERSKTNGVIIYPEMIVVRKIMSQLKTIFNFLKSNRLFGRQKGQFKNAGLYVKESMRKEEFSVAGNKRFLMNKGLNKEVCVSDFSHIALLFPGFEGFMKLNDNLILD